MDTIPVIGNSSLARDARTGAIVNINTHEIQLAKQRKESRLAQKQLIEDLQARLQRLEDIIFEVGIDNDN